MYTTPTATRELAFPGPLSRGSKGTSVKRLQEWLCHGGSATAIDSDFGPATERALKAFSTGQGRTARGALDNPTWGLLTAPLQSALSVAPEGASLPVALRATAQAHLAVHPREFGGDNCGPWVRLYTDGNEGSEWLWCAGFASFVLRQACAALGVRAPIKGSVSCDSLAAQAKTAGRFVSGQSLQDGTVTWSALGACCIFLVRRTSTDWTHTGFALQGSGETFATIEGNTNDDGSSNGYEVCARTRSVSGKDFITLG
jgi:peptidoglycan hydrolase-like protein with peptidoglycan-binding domain